MTTFLVITILSLLVMFFTLDNQYRKLRAEHEATLALQMAMAAELETARQKLAVWE